MITHMNHTSPFGETAYCFMPDAAGYWRIDGETRTLIPCGDIGSAPAALALDGFLYRHRGGHDTALLRTATPDDPDSWEIVGNTCYLEAQAALYYDPAEDRVWAFFTGGGAPGMLKRQELSRDTLMPCGPIQNVYAGSADDSAHEENELEVLLQKYPDTPPALLN